MNNFFPATNYSHNLYHDNFYVYLFFTLLSFIFSTTLFILLYTCISCIKCTVKVSRIQKVFVSTHLE